MFFEEKLIYTKRYLSAEEEFAQIEADATLPVISPEQKEKSWQELCRRMNSELDLEPIPGREEIAQEFIALAKKFSEDHEVDMDISQLPTSVDVSLHIYCSVWSKDMTSQFAKLLKLCDNLFSFIRKSEPSDFTLVLKLDTHRSSLDDILIDY